MTLLFRSGSDSCFLVASISIAGTGGRVSSQVLTRNGPACRRQRRLGTKCRACPYTGITIGAPADPADVGRARRAAPLAQGPSQVGRARANVYIGTAQPRGSRRNLPGSIRSLG